MRLPYVTPADADEVEIGLIGVPWDGGITTYDAQLLIRGLRGLNLIGGDVVEVSPPFDMSGNTALVQSP
jgi:arginase family enzyme